MQIDLNCDLGEGAGNDAAIMPLITSANIACGFHAGDEFTMRETVRLAKQFQVKVGAHPSWEDRENFGRREMNLAPQEAERMVFDQIKTLAEIAKAEAVELTHIKPHGALYNQSARDYDLAMAIARAVREVDENLILVGLANSKLIEAGLENQLQVAREGFPDRRYNADGSLISRSVAGAVIEAPLEIAKHALKLIHGGRLDTLCLHGDHPQALENAQLLRVVLEREKVSLIGLSKRQSPSDDCR